MIGPIWRRLLGACVLILCVSSPLWAQNIPPVELKALAQSVTLDVTGKAGAAIQLSGTFTATVTFEISVNGGDFRTQSATPSNSTTQVTTATAPGVWTICGGGPTVVRARVSAYTSGSIIVAMGAAQSCGAPGGSSSSSGPVTVADGADVTFGTTTDAKSSATDGTSITAMQVLKQISASVQAASGVTDADDASIATGQTASLQLGLNQAYDGSVWRRMTFGTAGTASAQVWTVQGIASMTPILSTLQTQTDTIMIGGANIKEINAVTPLMGNGATGTGALRVSIANDSTGKVVPWDGTRTAVLEPCQANAWSTTVVNISTATTTTVISASASNKNYICSMFLYASAADNVGIVEDNSGAGCGSPEAGLIGGTTAATGLTLIANQGFVLPATGYAQAVTASTNVTTCLITSAAVQLSGVIRYVQAP